MAEQGSAQTVQADQAELARTQDAVASAPNAYPGGVVDGHAVPTPNDSDLGEQEIVGRAERYQPFTASIALPFYWTSNAALTRSDPQSDFLLAPAAALTYQPRFSDTVYGFVSVREQLFYYNRFDNLNFGDFNVQTGVIFMMPDFHNLIIRGLYIYDRLTDKNSFDDFFYNNSIFVSLELPFQLGHAQQISIGTDANISFQAEPQPPQRSDYEVYLGYSVKLARAFSIDAVGRIVVRDYKLTDRVDVSEILALSANWSVTKFLTASAIGSLAANQSNHSVFDYKVANGGGLVSLSIRF